MNDSGLIGRAISAILAAVALRTQRGAARSNDGWRTLRASWFEIGILTVAVAFSGLLAFVILSGGSTRPDAVRQNLAITALFLASAGGTLYGGWHAFGRIVRWKGDELRVRGAGRRESVYRLSNVVRVSKHGALGCYRLHFTSKRSLRFSMYMHGASELVRAVPAAARQGIGRAG